jgi:hypothetical protein
MRATNASPTGTIIAVNGFFLKKVKYRIARVRIRSITNSISIMKKPNHLLKKEFFFFWAGFFSSIGYPPFGLLLYT